MSAMSVPNMGSTIHRQGIDRSTLVGCQLPPGGSGIAPCLLRLGRSSNDRGDDGMGEQPADRELEQRMPFAVRELNELLDDGEIFLG
jgi:hypothetical protein